MERIVVGIDFSESSRTAARWTMRHLAPQAEVTLVHAIDPPRPPSFLRELADRQAKLAPTLEAGVRERLADLAADLGPPAERTVVRTGRPFDVLAAVGDDVDAGLIVVGEHGARHGVWSVLGSTAEQLIRATDRPVLLARNLRDGPPRHILAAVDDGGLARAVLGLAVGVGGRTGADVTALHVLARMIRGHMRLVSTERKAEEVERALIGTAEAWLGAEVAAAAGGADVATSIVVGDPPYEILAAAQRLDADLIVMGTHGAGAVERALIGSVARAVMRAAPCPVLVVPSA